jgi:D-alanine-D-alanine ligase
MSVQSTSKFMNTKKPTIAIVAGGYSTEREVSLKSGLTVKQNMDPEEFEVHLIDITRKGWFHCADNGARTVVNQGDFSVSLCTGVVLRFDAVFMAIHGTPGEDGKLQSYFDLIGIPYNSCGAFEAALTFEKGVCNQLLRQYGIAGGQLRLIDIGDKVDTNELVDELGLPLFIKPSKAGSSFGVSKVTNVMEIPAAIEKAREFDDLVIVEEFLDGREITCGIFQHKGELIGLPPTEIISQNDFFDYDAKYSGESEEITPARITPETTKRVHESCKQIYRLLRLKGVCRMDFILRDGVPNLLEINTVPGLSEASILPQQVRCFGLDLRTFFGDQMKAILIKKMDN